MCVKLLIADDEDMIRNGIAKYIKLHTDRYETIYLAKNGQEALDIIYRHKPDIMLLDVQMPHKDGIEVMQEAYRAGVLPCTIILSGYDEFRYAQQAIRLGARDYLLKPSRSSDILKKLNAIADEKFKEPEEPVLLPEGRNRIVERAKDYLEEHYYEDLSLTEVAEYVGITASYLSNLFSKVWVRILLIVLVVCAIAVVIRVRMGGRRRRAYGGTKRHSGRGGGSRGGRGRGRLRRRR